MDDSTGIDEPITLQTFYRCSERRRRISVDVDINETYNPLQPLKIFTLLKHMFRESVVSIQRTRHGFHIKVVGEEIEKISTDTRLTIRELLGDDAMRVELDRKKLKENRYYAVDVLFDSKTGWDGKTSHPQEIEPYALPFWSTLPRNKRRKNNYD